MPKEDKIEIAKETPETTKKKSSKDDKKSISNGDQRQVGPMGHAMEGWKSEIQQWINSRIGIDKDVIGIVLGLLTAIGILFLGYKMEATESIQNFVHQLLDKLIEMKN